MLGKLNCHMQKNNTRALSNTVHNLKGNQPWILIGNTDADPEVSILWPPDRKSQLIGKDSDGEKAEGKRRRGGREWDG